MEIMTEKYDSSWDLKETDEGCLPDNEDAFDRKCHDWQKRNWVSWLQDHLTFPFMAERMEDEDDAYFTEVAKREPFSLGHIMKVVGIEPEEYDHYGVISQVKEGRKKGHVPLCDLAVTSVDDRNFWPVREYVVWFANR